MDVRVLHFTITEDGLFCGLSLCLVKDVSPGRAPTWKTVTHVSWSNRGRTSAFGITRQMLVSLQVPSRSSQRLANVQRLVLSFTSIALSFALLGSCSAPRLLRPQTKSPTHIGGWALLKCSIKMRHQSVSDDLQGDRRFQHRFVSASKISRYRTPTLYQSASSSQ